MIKERADPEEYKFKLNIDGEIKPAFDQLENGNDYVIGEAAMSKCVHGAYVLVVNYGPPYLKGFSIRFNNKNHNIERLDFAEKGTPLFMVNNPSNFMVVIPNENAGETTKYIIHKYNPAKALSYDKEYGNGLPSGKLIRLR